MQKGIIVAGLGIGIKDHFLPPPLSRVNIKSGIIHDSVLERARQEGSTLGASSTKSLALRVPQTPK